MVCEKLKHNGAYILHIRFLIFLMVLTVQQYIILAFHVNWCTSWEYNKKTKITSAPT
jgi:hypothetical protein